MKAVLLVLAFAGLLLATPFVQVQPATVKAVAVPKPFTAAVVAVVEPVVEANAEPVALEPIAVQPILVEPTLPQVSLKASEPEAAPVALPDWSATDYFVKKVFAPVTQDIVLKPKPLSETPKQTAEALKSKVQPPELEECATDQTVSMGENFYLCIRFNEDYERVGGSAEVLRYGHYYKWVLEDHELFDDEMTISCYVDNEYVSTYTTDEGGPFYCIGEEHILYLSYQEFIKGDRAQCHEPCNGHDDEVDNSRMRARVYQFSRLPSQEPKTTTNPLDDFVKRVLSWLG